MVTTGDLYNALASAIHTAATRAHTRAERGYPGDATCYLSECDLSDPKFRGNEARTLLATHDGSLFEITIRKVK